MAPTTHAPRILLDKNFLKAKSSGRLLAMLEKGGCRFVLTDALLYELGTSSHPPDWHEAQEQLFDVADAVEVWRHSATILKDEIQLGTPCATALDEKATEWTRGLYHNRQVAQNNPQAASECFQQREVASVTKLLEAFDIVAKPLTKLAARIWNKPINAITPECSDFVNDAQHIRTYLRRAFGANKTASTYVENAETRITPEWFAYHHARSILAMLCIFVRKYGIRKREDAWKTFPNAFIDSDYASLLTFADGIASEEKKEMKLLCDSLYGESKKYIRCASLVPLIAPHQQIAETAYERWCKGGNEHGHDVADWFAAERQLYGNIWDHIPSRFSMESHRAQ